MTRRAMRPILGSRGDAMALRSGLILALALSTAAGAQEQAKAVRGETAPELDGHVFMPSQVIERPFRSTTFKLGILYGFGSATGNSLDANGNVTGTADY